MLRPEISELFARDNQNLPSFISAGQDSDPTEHNNRSENFRLR
jgi:hypothetical protein